MFAASMAATPGEQTRARLAFMQSDVESVAFFYSFTREMNLICQSEQKRIHNTAVPASSM